MTVALIFFHYFLDRGSPSFFAVGLTSYFAPVETAKRFLPLARRAEMIF